MRQYISIWILAAILLGFQNIVNADSNNLSSLLKGKYAFTGVYNCLDAPDGFNSGQPVSPQYSTIASIVINGFMTFDGKGNATVIGNFVEIASPASPLNTDTLPNVDSGTFTIAPSVYTIAPKRSVSVNLGATTANILSGVNNGIVLVFVPQSSVLSGELSRNGSLLLTSSEPLVETGTVYAGSNEVASFQRMCSVTITLTP